MRIHRVAAACVEHEHRMEVTDEELLGLGRHPAVSDLKRAKRKAAKRKVASKTTSWRLLLQFDTDANLGIMWGDAGTTYFLIPEEDLAKADFSRCWAISQCG